MILGVLSISAAVATERERSAMEEAVQRECDCYGLSYHRTLAANEGRSESDAQSSKRSWRDYCIIAAALGVFVWLGRDAVAPALNIDYRWLTVLVAILVATARGFGWRLWRATRFS